MEHFTGLNNCCSTVVTVSGAVEERKVAVIMRELMGLVVRCTVHNCLSHPLSWAGHCKVLDEFLRGLIFEAS